MSNAAKIVEEVKTAVVGKDEVVIKVLLAILARGHILLEDIPGVGKTTLALAFSSAMDLQYSRVQFTPDVLPSDVTGYSVYQKETGRMVYQPGAVLCNLFLADELNRATSRTQSALLEAMEEGRVTVDGVSHPIPQPFTVIATQNPTGASGTQLLPDSQMDRFMLRLSMGYPRQEDEVELLRRKQMGLTVENVRRVVSRQELMALQDTVAAIHVSQEVMEYIVRLMTATRTHKSIRQGASPRAALALMNIAKASAYICGRNYVLPKDVKLMFHDTIVHRLLPVATQPGQRIDMDAVATEILNGVAAPKVR